MSTKKPKSGRVSRAEKARRAASSAAAWKGWETRRAREAERLRELERARRAEISRRGWETRRAREAERLRELERERQRAVERARAKPKSAKLKPISRQRSAPTPRAPTPQEKAAATRRANKARKLKRSAASKKGWETRRSKPKYIRDFEAERKKKQVDELKRRAAIDKARAPYAQYQIVRYADEFRFDVSNLSLEQTLYLLDMFQRRGVENVRYLREVPVYVEPTQKGGFPARSKYEGNRTPSGLISSRVFSLRDISLEQLEFGAPLRDVPGLRSMMTPGVDFLRVVIIKQRHLKQLPARLQRVLRGATDLGEDSEALKDYELTRYRLADSDEINLGEDEDEDDFDDEDDFEEDEE